MLSESARWKKNDVNEVKTPDLYIDFMSVAMELKMPLDQHDSQETSIFRRRDPKQPMHFLSPKVLVQL